MAEESPSGPPVALAPEVAPAPEAPEAAEVGNLEWETLMT